MLTPSDKTKNEIINLSELIELTLHHARVLAFEVGQMARADITVVKMVWTPWMVTRDTSDVTRIDALRKTKWVQRSDTDADVGDLSR